MAKSKIEWTEHTWNFITGCTKISPGCQNCYAERLSKRLRAMGQPKYVNGFQLTIHEDELAVPLTWRKSRMVFVNSMSDLFHEDVPVSIIQRAFSVMKEAYWHQFQILTKRSDRLLALSPQLEWAKNIWMGVSVEDQDYQFRIDHLAQTDAVIKFLSLEPLLGALPNINLTDVDWVIVGGESGVNSRPIQKEWVIDIQQQCTKADVPFFFKQWGGFNKKKAGRLLEGEVWEQVPKFSNRSYEQKAILA